MALCLDRADVFWDRVDRREPGECWEWTRYRDAEGYGQFWDSKRMVLAHRFAYASAVGEITSGHGVLHLCDNPPCCNPAHLCTGLNADNVAERVARGRSNRPTGERHPQSLLTTAAVEEIRNSYTGAYGQLTAYARRFGVSVSAVADVVKGRSWTS